MKFLKKNKIVVGVIVAVLIVLGIGFVILRSKNKQVEVPTGNQTQNIKKLSPEDIGFSATLDDDKKNFNIEISKLDGIKSIEYEFSYNAKPPPDASLDEGEMQDVSRGGDSTIEVKSSDSVIKKQITVGTCSTPGGGTTKCKYDELKSGIKFLVKVNFTNGEVGSVDYCLKDGSLDCASDSTGQ